MRTLKKFGDVGQSTGYIDKDRKGSVNVNVVDGRSHVKIGPSNCLLAVSRYLLRGKHVERYFDDTNRQSTIHLMIYFWCLSQFFGVWF